MQDETLRPTALILERFRAMSPELVLVPPSVLQGFEKLVRADERALTPKIIRYDADLVEALREIQDVLREDNRMAPKAYHVRVREALDIAQKALLDVEAADHARLIDQTVEREERGKERTR